MVRAGRKRFGQGRRTEVWSEQEERGLVRVGDRGLVRADVWSELNEGGLV